jgi:ABC-type sugar transport system substrate-binding protein
VFINYGNVSEYMVALSEQFKRLAEAEGAQVTLVDGKFDPVTQVKAMDDATAAGVDAIIVIPFDSKAIVESIKAARAKGILVQEGASLPDPGAPIPALIYNDTDIVHQGVADAVAWLKASKPGEKAKVVLFDEPGIVCHEWRMQPFEDEIKKVMGSENVEIVFHDYVDASGKDKVVAKMQDLLQAGNKFNIFSACGGTAAVGGIDALVEAGKAKAVDGAAQDLWAMSIDGTSGELKYLVDPKVGLEDTVARLPLSTAKLHLNLLKKMFSGEVGPDSNYTDVGLGTMFHKSDGCQSISDKIAAEYSVVPGYSALACSQ